MEIKTRSDKSKPDAHTLYEKFGFTPLKEPSRVMEKRTK